MKVKTLILAAAAVAALSGVSTPVFAQEAATDMLGYCDENKDGTVSRKEFVDSMGKMWDQKHGKMMKTDKEMKSGMMSRTQFMAFWKSTIDPGKIGGN